MSTKKVSLFGVLISLAFIFSYVETLLPIQMPIQGVKLGLANIVVITALYKLGYKEAFVLSMIRVFLVALSFGNLYTMIYSLAGGILSFTVMALMKSSKKFGIVGVSVMGGIAHNVGQIIVAMCVLESTVLIYYLPVLMISGVIAGIVIGLIGAEITKRLHI